MHKHSCATYLIAEIPGNRGLHRNACSEQINWIVISHLNSGVAKGGNTYCKHPMNLIKDLLQQQKKNCQNKSIILWNLSEDESWVRVSEEWTSNHIYSKLDQGCLSFRSFVVQKIQMHWRTSTLGSCQQNWNWPHISMSMLHIPINVISWCFSLSLPINRSKMYKQRESQGSWGK
jgi:hypothetical protein